MSERRVLRALPWAVVAVALAALTQVGRHAGADSPAPKSVRFATVYTTDLPAGPGKDRVEQSCLICHSVMLVTQQHKDSTAWEKTITQMVAWGAPLDSSTARPELRGYLVSHFGPRKSESPKAPSRK